MGPSASEKKLTRRQHLLAGLISRAAYPLIASLGATFKWRSEGAEHYDAVVRSGRQPIMAFWHGRILPATYYFRRRHRAVRLRRRQGLDIARGTKGPATAETGHGRRQTRRFHD